jgi:hypothetical protein
MSFRRLCQGIVMICVLCPCWEAFRIFSTLPVREIGHPRSGYPGLGAWATSLNQSSQKKRGPVMCHRVSQCVVTACYSSLSFSNLFWIILTDFLLPLQPSLQSSGAGWCLSIAILAVLPRGSKRVGLFSRGDPNLRWKTINLFTLFFCSICRQTF